MFLSLLACLPDLNGPVVLANGLGHSRSISLTSQDQLLVATNDGLLTVDYFGRVVPEPALIGTSLEGVVSHSDRLYVLDTSGRIGWRRVESQEWHWASFDRKPNQIFAWSNHQLILVFGGELALWSPDNPEPQSWRTGFASIIDMAYDIEEGCGGILLATEAGLVRSCEQHSTVLSPLRLDQISSSQNQIWGLNDGQVGLVTEKGLQEKRRFPATDMVFGASVLFPSHLLYGIMENTLELTQCLPEKLAQ